MLVHCACESITPIIILSNNGDVLEKEEDLAAADSIITKK